MDKILQILQLFLILRVASSRKCYLKPFSDKWCNTEIELLFTPHPQMKTFSCSNKDCSSQIQFFNVSEFNTFLTNEVIKKGFKDISVFENGRIQKQKATVFNISLDENLAVVTASNETLLLRNTTNDLYFKDQGKTKTLYFSVMNDNKQYIFKKIPPPRKWLLLNVREFSNEYLVALHDDANQEILLMGNKTVYKLADDKEACILLRSPFRFRCSESKQEIQIFPNSSICNGQGSIEFTRPNVPQIIDMVAYLHSDSQLKPCDISTTKNSNSCLIPEWPNEEEVTFVILFQNGKMFRSNFSYLKDPIITNYSSPNFYNWTSYSFNCSTKNVTQFCDNGKPLIFRGQYFNNVRSISITPSGLFNCFRVHIDNITTTIQCELISYRQSGPARLILDSKHFPFNYTLHDNPVFSKADMDSSLKHVTVYGKRLNLSATIEEYRITVNKQDCFIISLNGDELKCQLNTSDSHEMENGSYKITVTLQHRLFDLYYKPDISTLKHLIIPLAAVLILVVACFVFVIYLKKRKANLANDIILMMENEGKCLTDVTEIDVPFQKITQYIERILLIDKPRRYKKSPGGKKLPFAIQEKLGYFEVLLKNKFFILNVIKAMETKKNICYNENYELSLNLCLLLSFNLGFLLELSEELFKDLIHQTKKKERKKIMSRFNSIAESITKNWLALSMYPYIKYKFEPLLYYFVNEVRQFLTQGPIDEVTGNSQHYFFKSYSISKPIAHVKLKLQAVYQRRQVHLTALSCDSISQLKTKCLVAYQSENINSALPSKENIQIWFNGFVLNDYTEETDNNGCSLMATVATYNMRDGDQLYMEKVVRASTFDNETRYVTLGASVTVAPKEVNKSCHLEPEERRKSLSMNDISNMKLPTRLEDLLLELFSKMLDQTNATPPLKYIHNFFLHQAAKFSLNDGGKWTVNSYVIQMCSQFICHPNILLDIPMDLCVQKNLSALQQYIKEVISHPKGISSETCQVAKQINLMVSRFLSQLNEQPELDKNDVIKSLQDASALYTNGITIYKEISLYSLMRIMENNYVVVYKALEQNETARKLCLHDRFSYIFH